MPGGAEGRRHRMQRIGLTGCLTVALAVLMPAVARAQFVPPPPDPGFNYIFDGSATGSDASFDKWVFASGRAHDAGGVDDVHVGGRRRPVPAGLEPVRPAVHLLGRVLRAPGHARRDEPGRDGRAGDQRQREQPPALDAGLLRPRDPDQRVAQRRRRQPVDGSDQDRLGLRLPQPQLQAVGDLQAAGQGRVAHDGDPHDRPAVHGPGRRRDHQPVRQLDPQDRLAQRRPADDGAPEPARLHRAADARRQ